MSTSHIKRGMKPKILVIVGPTATGKSDMAVRLAKKFKGEIISADSRQVYTGLDIGTGKVTKKEMRGIPHHLLDVANPKKRFTVVEYAAQAKKALKKIQDKNKLPILAGGTGFYIEALVDGIILPEVPPNPKLRAALQKKTARELFNMIQKLDPTRAQTLDPQNIRRLIRAIEIAQALGKVPKIKKMKPAFDSLFIGLNLPKEELRIKIHDRLLKRMNGGMVKEVQKLHRNGLTWKRMDELGLEYRYLALYLQKKMTRADMLQKLETEIWHYTKRQLTWFLRDKRIQWFEPHPTKKIEVLVKKFLK